MGTTDYIAIYAAIVATSALLWNIYEWITSGPRIYLTARPNAVMLTDNRGQLYAYFLTGTESTEKEVYVFLSATNNGDKPTTISTPTFFYYKNWVWRIFRSRKPNKSFFIKNPAIAHSIPYLLQPGSVWEGKAIQNGMIEKLAKEGLLFFALFVSHRKKPMKIRVILKSKNNK